MNLVQFKASRSGEVGVQSQYLDGELYLVDNALAGSVAAAEKLQVLDSVVRADAVDVVDGFSGEQVASEMFGHDIAVFHSGVFFAGNERRHRYPDIAVAFDVAPVASSIKFFERVRPLRFSFASTAAKFLLCVDSASRFSPFGKRVATLGTSESASRFCIFFATHVGTISRAVQRVFVEFFPVSRKVRLHHNERLVAFFAGEMDWRAGCRNASAKSVGAATSETTVFSPPFDFAGVREKLPFANNAFHFERHGFLPLCGNEGSIAVSFGVSSHNRRG